MIKFLKVLVKMKLSPHRYIGQLEGFSGKQHLFPEQTIPNSVWDAFLYFYRNTGKIVGHHICLVHSQGGDILASLTNHLKGDIQPKMVSYPDEKDGWKLFHPQLAIHICERYGSPWLNKFKDTRRRPISYDEYRQEELLDLLGLQGQEIAEHIEKSKDLVFNDFLEYLEALYNQIDDNGKQYPPPFDLTFDLTKEKIPSHGLDVIKSGQYTSVSKAIVFDNYIDDMNWSEITDLYCWILSNSSCKDLRKWAMNSMIRKFSCLDIRRPKTFSNWREFLKWRVQSGQGRGYLIIEQLARLEEFAIANPNARVDILQIVSEHECN